jgi:hypothetical protein
VLCCGVEHFGGDMISDCGGDDIFNTAQESIWVWGTHHDDFKTPRNHRGALFCGEPKTFTLLRLKMQLPAAYQLTAYGPRRFTTNPTEAQPRHRASPPSSHQEVKIFQWSIGCKNTLCFQGGAEGAVVSGQVKLLSPGG